MAKFSVFAQTAASNKNKKRGLNIFDHIDFKSIKICNISKILLGSGRGRDLETATPSESK